MAGEEPTWIGRTARTLAALIALRQLGRRPRSGPPIPDGPAVSDGAPAPDPEDPSRRTVPSNPRAETLVAGLLLLAATCGFAFTVLFIVDSLDDQLLGLAIGLMFSLLAAAAIVAGKFVVPQETAVEDRGRLLEPGEPEEIVEMVQEGGEGISRRGLLAGAGGVAGLAVITATATPIASLGPRLTQIHATPWYRGRRMVDETGRPLAASEIQIGSFYTALPEGADDEQLGAPLLIVKLPEHYIHLPANRRTWAPEGILAYSKICPHAACAVSLYRYPTYGPTSDAQPAFTCPCHYSTFLPGEGGRLIFGPAGRALPQLPVMIDDAGHLRADGGFDEDVGPSWLDVRRPPTSA